LLVQRLSAPEVELRKQAITREDLMGALASFWLVVVACFPAGTPFPILPTPKLALNVSNAMPLAIGLALIGVAVLFGG
jgi:hypothetical protein